MRRVYIDESTKAEAKERVEKAIERLNAFTPPAMSDDDTLYLYGIYTLYQHDPGFRSLAALLMLLYKQAIDAKKLPQLAEELDEVVTRMTEQI